MKIFSAILGSLVIVFALLPFYASAEEPQNPYSEGIRHIRAGNFAKAADLLEEARRLTPGNTGVLYQLGIAWYNLERVDAAVGVWKEAAGRLPDGHMMKTTLLDIVKRADERRINLEKIGKLEKMLAEDMGRIEEGMALVALYEKEKRYDSMKEVLRKLAVLNQNDARPFAGLGVIAYKEGRLLWAEHYYGVAHTLNPGDSGINKKKNDIREELNDLAKAGYDQMVKAAH